MLKNDGSIDKIEEDKLNRKDFIERIIEGILGYKDTDSLVIGLEGNWGSGKTSILNIIEKELENKKIEVFKFNPWNFSIRKQLVSDFFEQFSLFLGSRSNTKEALKEVSKSLMKISYILKPITTITGVVPIVGNMTKGIEELGKSYEQFSNTIDLETIKKGVTEALEEGNEKIIIFIDDLDRLLDSEICEVLQFVKGVGDLKNIIYILAYDKQIVINSLGKVTSNKGEEYLKKIVQIQMELPIITSTKIGFLFKNEIEDLFYDKISKMESYELEYLCEVFGEILMFLPKTIRDLKRIMNNIRFGRSAIESLNLTDYILIKSLEAINYDIYKQIKENKDLLVVSTKIKLEDTEILNLLSNLSQVNKVLMEKILKIIFEKRQENIPTNKKIAYQTPRRICNSVYFYDYFSGNVEKKELSKMIEKELMQIKTMQNFKEYLQKIEGLDEISEIVLNTQEYIFYKDFASTRGVHLLNLLEKYILKNEQRFNNTIILKNKIGDILFEDLISQEKFLDVNEIEIQSFSFIKFLWEFKFKNKKDIHRKLLEIYFKNEENLKKTLEMNLKFLESNLLTYDKFYFLGLILENVDKNDNIEIIKDNIEFLYTIEKEFKDRRKTSEELRLYNRMMSIIKEN